MKKISKPDSEKNFFEYLKSALKIIKLDRKTISEISSDKNATKFAVLVLIITSFFSSLIGLLLFPDSYKIVADTFPFISIIDSWFNLIISPILSLVFLFVWAVILNLFGKWLGSHGSYMGLFRIFGFTSILSIFSRIPIINFLVSIWFIVIIVVTISENYKLTTGKAFLVYIMPIVMLTVLFILSYMFVFLFLFKSITLFQ